MPSVATNNDAVQPLKVHEWISLFCCFLMTTGMVCSRLLLSIGMIILFVNALHPKRIGDYWRKIKESRFALFALLFFVAYIVSGIWSADKSNWMTLVQIKLPFLIFPFALVSLPLSNVKWFKLMIAGLLAALFGGMTYSFSFLLAEPQNYLGGNHMPSPMEGDYIRFTIVISLAMVFIVYLLKNEVALKVGRLYKILMLIWFFVAVAYIYIQAAKSGIVSFYIFYGMFVLHYGYTRKQLLKTLGLIAIGVVGFIVFSKLPAMSSQLNKMSYEKQVLETSDTAGYTKTGSVVPRVNSYKVAAEIISQNLLIGVGAGDMKHEMDEIYEKKYANLPESSRILPHNELLCSLLAIGVPMTICTFIFMLFWPLYKKNNRRNIYFITTWSILFFGLMIEPMLEVQYGIFVFLFFMYLWPEIPKLTTDSE